MASFHSQSMEVQVLLVCPAKLLKKILKYLQIILKPEIQLCYHFGHRPNQSTALGHEEAQGCTFVRGIITT